MPRVLLLEDNHLFSQTIQQLLANAECSFAVSSTVGEATELLREASFDLAIIDRQLPDGDGIEVVEWLHQESPATRTLVLSHRNQDTDKIAGFSYGADDYVTKPCNLQELLWRVRRLLEKKRFYLEEKKSTKAITLFKERGKALVAGKMITLTKTETLILECLVLHPNQVISKDQLFEYVWGVKDKVPLRESLEVYIRRLRGKLGSDGQLIKTIRGFGYTLDFEAVSQV